MNLDALPVPDPDTASAAFFGALDQGRLEILRCIRCDTPHLAAITCDACGGTSFQSEPASGQGILYSFTRTHMAHHSAFADDLPFAGGIVELDEGPRLFAPLLGTGNLRIGQPVQLELLAVGNRNVAAFRMSAED